MSSYLELISEFTLLCRGCLSEPGQEEMKNMYEWGLYEDFKKITGVEIQISDSITHLLCKSCEEKLSNCKLFRTQCQQSDLLLRSRAKKKGSILQSDDDAKKKGLKDQEIKENIVSCMLLDKKLLITVSGSDMDSKIYFSCPYKTKCRDKFLKKKYLLSHMVNNHNVDGKDFYIDIKYNCPFRTCSYHLQSGYNKSFTERKFLNQHIMKVHKSKVFFCTHCSFNTALRSEYERHIKTCGITYSCQLCNVKYETNERLMVHLLRKHPDLHNEYKRQKKAIKKRISETVTESKKRKTELDDICNSPKRSFATQTLLPELNIKNDVTLPSWNSKSDGYETKTDEISTQTVFEDLLSLKSQTSEDDSIFFSETVSLSDIQTQTFPVEFGLSRMNKETLTSETQSPDLSIKETQTCYCLYDSPKLNLKLFDSVSSSPSSINLTSTETQTAELRTNLKSDVLLSFSSTETQTCFESSRSKNDL